MAQLFSTPGDVLEGLQKTHFLEIKAAADRATNDLLLHADWEAVLQTCDQVNGCLDSDIITELIFLLRRKLGSVATILNPVSTKQVQLTLNLVEALVKNCGTRLHRAVNDETFMNEMKRVAKRFANKSGSENVQVAELALDIIQAWGEGFLTKRRQFPNIVDAYHELKKDGMPFRAQYDPSRVPIFTPDGPSSGTAHADSTDAILASAMSSDMAMRGSMGGRDSVSSVTGNDTSQAGAGDMPESIHTSIRILADLLLASCGTQDEASSFEVARELVAQIVEQQDMLADRIEAMLLTDETDALAALFALNDEVATVISAYKGAVDGSMSMDQLQEMLRPLASTADTPGGGDDKKVQVQVQVEAASEGTFDLLDFDSSPRSADHAESGAAETACGQKRGGGLLDMLSAPIDSYSKPAQSADPFASNDDTFAAPAPPPAPSMQLGQAPSAADDLSLDLLDFGTSTPSSAAAAAPAAAATKKGLPILPPPPGPTAPSQRLAPPPEQKAAADLTNPFDLF